MSRIGKKPIIIPDNVKVVQDQDQKLLIISGPLGILQRIIPEGIFLTIISKQIEVNILSIDKEKKSLFGLTRTLIANMIIGVTNGFQKNLEIIGVGYKAEIIDKNLKLFVGFSTPLIYLIPDGISIKVEKQILITVLGVNKEQVGMVAADIRSLRKPEPYKGKGIRYLNEFIKRKIGKSAGA